MPDKIISPTNSSHSDNVKLAISAIYVLVPLGLLALREFQGRTVDSLILLIVVMLMFASAYVIFGEKIVDKATEQAKDVSGQEEPEPQETK